MFSQKSNIGENMQKDELNIPKISAVMALYNTPMEFLEKTVESILNQTLADFEFIIADDASSIQYSAFFDKLNDDRIKYFKLEKNSGPGGARNFGIKKARGQYIAIVDSDDIYMPERFQIQSDFLDKNPEISLLSVSYKFSGKNRAIPVLENDSDIKAALLFNSSIANPSVMFKREVFLEKNLYYSEDINFAEDYSLWIQAMSAGIKMANIDDVLMIYTRRKNQMSKVAKEKQIKILKDIYKNIFAILEMEVSRKEIDLHYQIYEGKFCKNVDADEIINWFDKIIESNKNKNIFDGQKLEEKKNETLDRIKKSKSEIFKIKIGNHNLCFYKPLKIKIIPRT